VVSDRLDNHQWSMTSAALVFNKRSVKPEASQPIPFSSFIRRSPRLLTEQSSFRRFETSLKRGSLPAELVSIRTLKSWIFKLDLLRNLLNRRCYLMNKVALYGTDAKVLALNKIAERGTMMAVTSSQGCTNCDRAYHQESFTCAFISLWRYWPL